MIATLQMIDLGPIGAVRSLARRPDLDDVAGLRRAETMLLAPLAVSRPPAVRAVGLLAFWDGEADIDRFVSSHPVGTRYSGGVEVRMRPLRAFGSWPGLPEDLPAGRAVPHEGPVVVVTLARVRGSQVLRFARASRPAEKLALTSDGLIWGTAALRVPFLATVTMWESTQAAAAYAYGRQRPAHGEAMAKSDEKAFHHESAFIRFAPMKIEGSLGGSNPLDASTISLATT